MGGDSALTAPGIPKGAGRGLFVAIFSDTYVRPGNKHKPKILTCFKEREKRVRDFKEKKKIKPLHVVEKLETALGRSPCPSPSGP